MTKRKPLATTKKQPSKAKKETTRPIPRRTEKTRQKTAKCGQTGKDDKKKKELAAKADPLARALLGFVEALGMKPVRIEVEIEDGTPKKKPSKGKKSGKRKVVK